MIDRKLTEILEELSGLTGFAETDALQADLGLDSLSLVNLLLLLEDVYNFTLDESDMDPTVLVTVADVAALIEEYRKNR